MTSKYSKEEKIEYFKTLRAEWQAAKNMSVEDNEHIQAIIRNHGMNVSATGFKFVQMQMTEQGLDGLPYLDIKTFMGWKDNGFKVKKGSKSTVKGITWITVNDKAEGATNDEDGYMLPKVYHLFHRSQVEEVAVD